MNKELYLSLRQLAISKYDIRIMRFIREEYGLSYRTVTGLARMISNEPRLNLSDIQKYTNPNYYTAKNAVSLVKKGLIDIVPEKYFENQIFLQKTGISRLPDGFLMGNKDIISFNIVPEIKEIGDFAFAGCDNLIDICFESNNIKEIGAYAFKDCYSFKTSFLPPGALKLNTGAYSGCKALEAFCLNENINILPAYVFDGCENIKHIVGAEKLSVGRSALRDNKSLTSISGVIEELSEKSLYGCGSLESIELAVSYVPKMALCGCGNLKSICFRKIPRRYERDSFLGCNSLETVTADGFSYQFRETYGFCELTRNFRPKLNPRGCMSDFFCTKASPCR